MGRYDDKTEKPTPRRRNEARKEGQVARSQEVAVAASLVVAVLAVKVLGPATAGAFGDTTREILGMAGTAEINQVALTDAGVRLFIVGVGPFLLAATIAGLVAGFGQVGFGLAPKALMPKLKKISPKQGLEKFRLSNAGWELARSMAKLGMLLLVVMAPINDLIASLDRVTGLMEGIERTVAVAGNIILRAAVLMLVIASADYAVNRYKHERGLKMSKDDVKQEHKSQEGDPQFKAARRRKGMEFSRNRMLAAVASADVVVTNPTHFAVALRYDAAKGAPQVIAKGVDSMAQKIKREARRNGVMVVENRPLARGLYRRVKLEGFVPSDLYEAVAVVLAMVYRRRGQGRPVALGSAA